MSSRYPGGGGSLRDPAAQHAVLRATRELLAELGYARLTIEAIAQRAGVGKPTIYRWWRNKAEIVCEAVWAPPDHVPPDTGDLETDLRGFVERLVDYFSRPEVIAAFPGLVSEMFSGAEGVSVVYEFSRKSLDHLHAIVNAARSRGDVRADVDVSTVGHLVLGAVLSIAMARTRAPSGRLRSRSRTEISEGIVAVVLGGITGG